MAAALHVSPYGGSWYPGRRDELERLLEDLFARSEERTGAYLLPNPLGFVVPHAGLEYSGVVAAAAYRYLRQFQAERIVILGFSHRGGPPGISIPDLAHYATPLGPVPTSRQTMVALAKSQPFHLVPEDRVCDHSVEIQLPLLQWAAPRAQVVPLSVGHLNTSQRDAAAQSLAALCVPSTLFLVSSDLTHYGKAFGYQPFPPDSKIAERLRDLDGGVMEAAGSLDAEWFRAALLESGSTACGVSPIALWLRTLAIAQGEEIFQECLDYQTSGDVTGDYDHTVSYGALGYFPASSFRIGERDQSLLLESARETLESLRTTRETKEFPPRERTPALAMRAGVFVSLHQGEELLGCVGNRCSHQGLADNVPETTLRAALGDPRFPTVLGVSGAIDIEISILTPFKRIRDARAFRIHEHGAWLELGERQGLLLPQVARGRDWTGEQFLRALSVKAGLGTQGHRNPDARLNVFRAQVFGSTS